MWTCPIHSGFMAYTAVSHQEAIETSREDVLASLLSSCHIVHLYMKSMIITYVL